MIGLRVGFYISKRKEKVYISNVKNNMIFYAGAKGKGAKRFRTREDAHEYSEKYKLEKDHKIISVR